MASSTTMPMASTRPNSDRLLRLKPNPSITANVPTIATGTAISGMSVARQDCKKGQHHDRDENDGVAQRLEYLRESIPR